ATAALAASGYQAERANHHYRVIDSLSLTLGTDAETIKKFDIFRKRRVENFPFRRSIPLMNSTRSDDRDVVLSALNHRDCSPVPIDFGSTAVTGIHASCVAALRDHYGLEKRLVKVHEPFQMLGLVEEDLQNALGIGVTGVFARKSLFGFPINNGWKPWNFNGLEVLIPQDFNTTIGPNGDTLIYPEGDLSVPPSGRMPQGGYFFDAIIRQSPIDEGNLNPVDNMEEFTAVSDEDITWLANCAKAGRLTGRAVIANFGGTAYGDIALVPAPFLK